MNGSLSTGVSALKSFTKGIETIGNNIANVNSTAFKRSRVEYAQNFVDTLERSSAAPGDGEPNTSSRLQVGGGVQIDAISTNFTQGSLVTTGLDTDLAIDGRGFFQLREVDSTGQPIGVDMFTRAGNFRIDETGFIVNPDGFRLVGTNDLDINVAFTTTNGVSLEAVRFDTTGNVKLLLSDGTVDSSRGTVKLQDFRDPQALIQEGKGIFTNNINDSAGRLTTSVTAGTDGLGLIRSNTLELSNVDLTEEFSNMITTQRSFQAGARIITTTDQLLSEAVNLKR
jgi:flagellar hook protein FlgE